MTSTQAPAAQSYKMTTPIPPSITTPPRVETRIGALEFFGQLTVDLGG